MHLITKINICAVIRVGHNVSMSKGYGDYIGTWNQEILALFLERYGHKVISTRNTSMCYITRLLCQGLKIFERFENISLHF